MDAIFDICDENKTIHITVTDEKRIAINLIKLGFNEYDEYPLSDVISKLPLYSYLMENINGLDKSKNYFFTFYIH